MLLMLSLVMSPVRVSWFAVKVTLPPLEPEVPQLPAAALMSTPEVPVTATLLERLMTALVLVT